MARKRKQNFQSSEDILMENNIFDTTLGIEEDLEPKPLYKVRITHPSLRKRKAPNTLAEVKDLITDMGVYDIYDEVNGWGKLKDDTWIMLTYTETII